MLRSGTLQSIVCKDARQTETENTIIAGKLFSRLMVVLAVSEIVANQETRNSVNLRKCSSLKRISTIDIDCPDLDSNQVT